MNDHCLVCGKAEDVTHFILRYVKTFSLEAEAI
jgi:hypothetical protein